MTLWRLEWTRLVRTKRWLVLVAPFVGFGFAGPLVTKNLPALLSSSGDAATRALARSLPPPAPADAFDAFVRNASQIGVLVTVIAAAAALSFDSTESAGVFLRTRVRSVRRIVVPRTVVPAAAAVAAFTLGSAAAWYETLVLVGPLPAWRLVLSVALVGVYLTFAVCVAALACGVARSVVGSTAIAIGVLLAMPVAGAVGALSPWLPSGLLGAPARLLRGGDVAAFARPAVVAVVAGVACVAAGGLLAARREL